MLLMKDILREGNEILNKKSAEVSFPFTKEDENIIISMIEYIENSIDEEVAKEYNLRPAVGLAAPQIGVLKKMIVINAFDEHGKEHFYPMVNPKIISYSDDLTYLPQGEGCLSVDREVEGLVHRYKRITIQTYIYENGELIKKTFRLRNYIAIVFQHEFDHLNGILFPERINQENPLFVPENSTPIKFDNEEEHKDKES